MRTATAVQLSGRGEVGTFALTVADPGREDNDSPIASGIARVKAVSVELPVDDITWADSYAEYRNALAEVEAELAEDGSKLPKRYSRKSLLEELLQARIRRTQKLLEPVTTQLGALPPPDDKSAMKKYARRALALINK